MDDVIRPSRNPFPVSVYECSIFYLLGGECSPMQAPLHLLLVRMVGQLVYLVAQQFGQSIHLHTLKAEPGHV